MIKAQLSPCSRLKMETASVDLPKVSGNLLNNLILMMMRTRFCLTFLKKVTCLTIRKADKYGANVNKDLVLGVKDYKHLGNHLMA
jgi:hypothetical protein